jgi:hypothetical protein
MSAIVLVVTAGLAAGVLVLIVVSWGTDRSPDARVESEIWCRATGEVISVLRTHSRTFVLVRYSVGTSLIQNHVAYPLRGATPRAGQRMPIKYDAVSPARVEFDLRAHNHMPPTPPGRAAAPSQGTHPGSDSVTP